MMSSPWLNADAPPSAHLVPRTLDTRRTRSATRERESSGSRCGRRLGAGEPTRDDDASAVSARDAKFTFVRLDDLAAESEPETRALLFRREERDERIAQNV